MEKKLNTFLTENEIQIAIDKVFGRVESFYEDFMWENFTYKEIPNSLLDDNWFNEVLKSI